VSLVVDTDVASTLLRRRTSDALARQLPGQAIAITFVT
jgi:predicted nucleic acid-binding protein